MTNRLPVPGEDKGTWGLVLNDFLTTSLATDGTIKPGVVTKANLAPALQSDIDSRVVSSNSTVTDDVVLTQAAYNALVSSNSISTTTRYTIVG